MNPHSQKMVRSIQYGVAALITTLLVACSPSQPSVADGERSLRARITSESEGRIKLVSFKETHGQKMDVAGIPFYFMEYQAEIEFTEDCQWERQVTAKAWGFRTVKRVAQPLGGAQNPLALVIKGHRETVSGTIAFGKTRKGWGPTEK